MSTSTEPSVRWWVSKSRALFALAFPLILTNFAYVALTTVDIVMLGRLGAADIAAAGLAIALFNQLRTTGTGLVTGVSNLVAEARVLSLLFPGRSDTRRLATVAALDAFHSGDGERRCSIHSPAASSPT